MSLEFVKKIWPFSLKLLSYELCLNLLKRLNWQGPDSVLVWIRFCVEFWWHPDPPEKVWRKHHDSATSHRPPGLSTTNKIDLTVNTLKELYAFHLYSRQYSSHLECSLPKHRRISVKLHWLKISTSVTDSKTVEIKSKFEFFIHLQTLLYTHTVRSFSVSHMLVSLNSLHHQCSWLYHFLEQTLRYSKTTTSLAGFHNIPNILGA